MLPSKTTLTRRLLMLATAAVLFGAAGATGAAVTIEGKIDVVTTDTIEAVMAGDVDAVRIGDTGFVMAPSGERIAKVAVVSVKGQRLKARVVRATDKPVVVRARLLVEATGTIAAVARPTPAPQQPRTAPRTSPAAPSAAARESGLPRARNDGAALPPQDAPAVAESPRPIRRHLADGLEYAWLPAGAFAMGCSAQDSECEPDENPGRQVTLTKGFWMGRTEVTVGAYRRVVGSAPPGQGADDHPVVNVTWEEARAYCSAVGGRLPTEAEWEYAARGARAGLRYPWGETISHEAANYSGVEGRDRWERTSPVGSFDANGFALFDVVGNVREWSADWYGPYAAGSAEDPQGPPSGTLRVVRGGSWVNTPSDSRLSDRFKVAAAGRAVNLGFRCLREVAP